MSVSSSPTSRLEWPIKVEQVLGKGQHGRGDVQALSDTTSFILITLING